MTTIVTIYYHPTDFMGSYDPDVLAHYDLAASERSYRALCERVARAMFGPDAEIEITADAGQMQPVHVSPADPMNASGDEQAEALREAIETAVTNERWEVLAARSRMLTVRVTPGEYLALEQAARQRGQSLSERVRSLLF